MYYIIIYGQIYIKIFFSSCIIITNGRALFAMLARSNLNYQEPGCGDTKLSGKGREEDTHCYFLRGIDNGSGHHAVSLVSQSIFDDNNSMLDCGKLVMFCCRPKPSSKDTSPVQTGPLSINFPGS